MGLVIGGYRKKPDYARLGTSLIIATSIILAIRKAKHPVRGPGRTETEVGLDQEIAYCAHLARSVMMYLTAHDPALFAQVEEPWFVPDEGDVQP